MKKRSATSAVYTCLCKRSARIRTHKTDKPPHFTHVQDRTQLCRRIPFFKYNNIITTICVCVCSNKYSMIEYKYSIVCGQPFYPNPCTAQHTQTHMHSLEMWSKIKSKSNFNLWKKSGKKLVIDTQQPLHSSLMVTGYNSPCDAMRCKIQIWMYACMVMKYTRQTK